DPRVGPAPAEVAAHGVVDVGVGGPRGLPQEHGGGHDLARLAVAALRYVRLDPRHLQRVPQIGGQALDRHHLRARGTPHRRDTRTNGLAVEVDGAGTAQGHAASELGAGEAQRFAEDPEQRRVGGDVHRVVPTVDIEGNHACALPKWGFVGYY